MSRRRVNLALQGGGAHGAFTWGALDRLLEEDEIEIEGITATSAGAMNAAALKQGWVAGGRDGARKSLEEFWYEIAGIDGRIPEPIIAWLRMIAPSPSHIARALETNPAFWAGETVARVFSPYQFNPLNYHPLRKIVDDLMDYDRVCDRQGPKLFIAATHVKTGKARIFHGKELCTDTILASACLPTLYQAIEIDDPRTGQREAYWDGGYMGNPALYPLFYHTQCPDIVIVHINPLESNEVPVTATDIANRINEISFNASLLRELRNIDFVNRLIEDGVIPKEKMKRNHIHSVLDDSLMNQLGVATKLTPNRALLLELRDAGRAAMHRFLRDHGDDIGKRSSVDLRAMFTWYGSDVAHHNDFDDDEPIAS